MRTLPLYLAGFLFLGVVDVAAGAPLAAGPRVLEPLAFLLGEWPSPGTGQAGEPTGRAVFSRGLQDRVILRNNFADYPATERGPASHHEDLMIIYALPNDSLRADYFDNEGHVIRYRVRVPGPGKATFLSEASSSEPRFRLSYGLDPAGVLKGTFEVAPPGAPDAFKPYLSWESRKEGTTPR